MSECRPFNLEINIVMIKIKCCDYFQLKSNRTEFEALLSI